MLIFLSGCASASPPEDASREVYIPKDGISRNLVEVKDELISVYWLRVATRSDVK